MSDARAPRPCFACVFLPSASQDAGPLVELAQAFSPRYEHHRPTLVSIDVTGLERLMQARVVPRPGASTPGGAPRPSAWRTLGEELVRSAIAKGMHARVAVAGTRVAALVLAHARPGLTVVESGGEAAALAPVTLDVLAQVAEYVVPPRRPARTRGAEAAGAGAEGLAQHEQVETFKHWALRTLGEVAALPTPDLMARLGRQALVWQAIARGDDVRPLVPSEPDERFEGTLELEWPIEGLEPLSFVLTRLLEPLSTQLERRDRGAAVLHVTLDLVSREVHARHLQLPSPLRDVRTLRTLALLDIESHPPAGAIDRVSVVIDPTPGRVVQHTLFTRAHPTPERLSTLLARLGAVMGHDRIGAPDVVDSYRPGAFTMRPFATEHAQTGPLPPAGARPALPGLVRRATVVSASSSVRTQGGPEDLNALDARTRQTPPGPGGALPGLPGTVAVSALRRCRQPVPARVVAEGGRPVRVTTDRRGFAGGSVTESAGPWRTSGQWWEADPALGERVRAETEPGRLSPALHQPWDRDEWDVALSDGALYRIFRDRQHDAWYIEGMFD